MDVTKSKLPMMTVVGLLASAAGYGASYAVAAEKISTQGARIERLEARQDGAAKEAEQLRLQGQQTTQALMYVVEKVKEISEDVKEMKKRR